MNGGPLRGKNGECDNKFPHGNGCSSLDTVTYGVNDMTCMVSLPWFLLFRSWLGRSLRRGVLP